MSFCGLLGGGPDSENGSRGPGIGNWESGLICVLDSYRMGAWVDFSLMLLTFVATVVWNVEVGIAVSVAVSLLIVVRNSSKAHIKILVSILVSSLSTILFSFHFLSFYYYGSGD